ncbi:MAG: flavodoxin family protein [Candidatus Bipolaricaulota bacterium]
MDDRRRVLILVGSPRRNGNSASLAEVSAHAAREAGADVETVFLHEAGIGPCTGCGACRASVEAECVLRDGMTPLYPKLRAAHAILIATPIYSYDMTAQTKLLIDRLYALGSRDGNALKGKRFGFLIVYGAKDEVSSGAATAMRCFRDTFERKAQWMDIVHGTAGEAGSALGNARLVAEAARLGTELARAAR